VDDDVGRVERGVFQVRQRPWRGEVDGLGQRRPEPVEVRRRVADGEQDALARPVERAFKILEGRRERRPRLSEISRIEGGRGLRGEVGVPEDVVSRRADVAAVVGRQGVVPRVLALGDGRRVAGRDPGETLVGVDVETGREADGPADGDGGPTELAARDRLGVRESHLLCVRFGTPP